MRHASACHVTHKILLGSKHGVTEVIESLAVDDSNRESQRAHLDVLLQAVHGLPELIPQCLPRLPVLITHGFPLGLHEWPGMGRGPAAGGH